MRFKYMFLAIGLLALAALACGGDDDVATPTSVDTPTTAPSADILFEEDFADDDQGWPGTTTENYTLGVANGEYVATMNESELYLWSVPGQSLSDVHIEVTIRNTGQANDNAFGVVCNLQDGDNHYFLGFGSDGFYAIARAQDGETRRLSSADDLWIQSPDIPVNAASYQLGADCADGRLALYVNGRQIAEVNDSTFTSGDVGLFMATFEQAGAEVHFDNFVVTEK